MVPILQKSGTRLLAAPFHLEVRTGRAGSFSRMKACRTSPGSPIVGSSMPDQSCLFREMVENLPVSIVFEHVDREFDRRLVAVGRDPAKPHRPVLGRSKFCVVKRRPVSVPNATPRTNRDIHVHRIYPRSRHISSYPDINTRKTNSCQEKGNFVKILSNTATNAPHTGPQNRAKLGRQAWKQRSNRVRAFLPTS